MAAVVANRRPMLEEIQRLRNRTNALAEPMIEQAAAVEDIAERRIDIRASVSAEPVASALADYILAFPADDQDAKRAKPVQG